MVYPVQVSHVIPVYVCKLVVGMQHRQRGRVLVGTRNQMMKIKIKIHNTWYSDIKGVGIPGIALLKGEKLVRSNINKAGCCC